MSIDNIQNKIINQANNDDRVRIVILNCSRANPKVTPDNRYPASVYENDCVENWT